MRTFILMGLSLGLAGCMALPPEPQPLQRPTAELGSDTCGAAGVSNLMGAPRSVVEFVTLEQPKRIVGVEDTMTTDFDPTRVNFTIGASGVVTNISCG
ncbi:MAG: I78 family peptidase inhibitor [Marivita sp.]|uniref:I78 family peptidase inhibitor n=1 Tax=Marivita sp. TaxID=2003365 RepID=UPI003EF3CF6B